MQSRRTRVTIWLAGFVVYLTLLCILVERGDTRAEIDAGLWLLSIWGAVLLILVLLPPDPIATYGVRLAVVRAVWLCVGAIVLALLLPGPARFLLLTVPFVGIAFASTRLPAHEVLLVVLLTWLGYVVAEGWLVYRGIAALEESVLIAGVFSLSLAAMLSSGLEIAGLHQMLNQQRLGMQQNLDRLQMAALQDELTGVYNRRFVMEVLARELAYADRENQPLAVCYCDLDHFKALNDRHGHARGDLALREFAMLAISVVRSVDYVARIGGEEFLLVLVGVDAARARVVAERLCTGTRLLGDGQGHASTRFTVSCGVTQYVAREGVQSLLERADSALYAAKRGGRDRVVQA